jgi:hypothetical protein
MILSSFNIYTKSIGFNPQHVIIWIDLNSAIESTWSFIINKDLEADHMDLEKVKPKPIDLNWAKRCYMNLNIK